MSEEQNLPLEKILLGDCVEVLNSLAGESVDLIFADPPYNLQLRQELWRPNQTRVNAVSDDWDRFESFSAYDSFCEGWIKACRRVLKHTGTVWVIGSYHNIYRIGKILQDLGFWILNDVVWIKSNPMPNFRGVRFTNAHEMLIWAQKERGAPYTFNYQALKTLNDNLQMRSDWYIPICSGGERIRLNGEKAHPTQKPEALLHRIIQSSSKPGDIVLDPFFGTGTTGVVARRLHRRWIGIESEERYVAVAQERIRNTPQDEYDKAVFEVPNPRNAVRVPFGILLEHNLLQVGQTLYLGNPGGLTCRVLADGNVECNGQRGSIHQIAVKLRHAPCNGWDQWLYYDEPNGKYHPVSRLREIYREKLENLT